eukprot:scaffold46424_cov389-Amphora_coffeaeformis.AAC.1
MSEAVTVGVALGLLVVGPGVGELDGGEEGKREGLSVVGTWVGMSEAVTVGVVLGILVVGSGVGKSDGGEEGNSEG